MVNKSDSESEEIVHEVENTIPVQVICKNCDEPIAYLDDFITTRGPIWTIECCELFDAMNQHSWEWVYCKCEEKIAKFCDGFDVAINRGQIKLHFVS